jgi:anti-anti-sigma factor
MAEEAETAEESAEDTLKVSTSDWGVGADAVRVLSAVGDLDLVTSRALRDTVEPYLSGSSTAVPGDSGPRPFVLDLRQVEFIDSAGLALLVEIRKRCMDRDACRLMLLIERGSQPERVLKLGRFDTFIQILYSLEELARHDDSASTQ